MQKDARSQETQLQEPDSVGLSPFAALPVTPAPLTPLPNSLPRPLPQNTPQRVRKRLSDDLVITSNKRQKRLSHPTRYKIEEDKFSPDPKSSIFQRRIDESLECTAALHGAEADGPTDGQTIKKLRSTTVGIYLELEGHATMDELMTLLKNSSKTKILRAAARVLKENQLELAGPNRSDEHFMFSLCVLYGFGQTKPLTERQYTEIRRGWDKKVSVRGRWKTKNDIPMPYDEVMSRLKKLPELQTDHMISAASLLKDYCTVLPDKLNQLCGDVFQKPNRVAEPKVTGAASRKIAKMRDKKEAKKPQTPCQPSASHQTLPLPETDHDGHYLTELLGSANLSQDLLQCLRLFSDHLDGCYNDLMELAPSICRLYSMRLLMSCWYRRTRSPSCTGRRGKLSFDCVCVPMGHHSERTMFTLSCLNTIDLFNAHTHNHMLAIFSLPEDHPLIQFYVERVLVPAMKTIEQQRFEVAPFGLCQIRFFCVFDQKMMAQMAGEANNAFTFPTTLGKISKHQFGGPNGLHCSMEKVGVWSLKERHFLLKAVEKEKAKIRNFDSLAPSTQHQKTLDIMKRLKTRQIINPPMDVFVERFTPEPLHCVILCSEHEYKHFLNTLMWATPKEYDTLNYKKMPLNVPIKQFLEKILTITKSKEQRELYKRSTALFDTKGKCQMRFKGLHAKLILRNAGVLFSACYESLQRHPHLLARCLVHIYVFKQLRSIFALALRVEITEAQIAQMALYCRRYYVALNLFSEIFNTAWIVGCSFPFYSRFMLKMLGLGLGAASMQGPEAKNATFQRFGLNTNNHDVFAQILRHDFVCSRYLPGNLEPKDLASEAQMRRKQRRNLNLLDETEDLDTCLCGLVKRGGHCMLCGHELYAQIENCVLNEQITGDLLDVFNNLKKYEKMFKPELDE